MKMNLALFLIIFVNFYVVIITNTVTDTTFNNTFLEHIKKSPILQGLDDDERELNERCKDEIICTEKDLNGPKICGTNGKTYHNPCELNKIVCYGKPVEMHSMGDCIETERCSLEREFQLKLIRLDSKKYSNEFVPMCNKTTNYYSEIQCHTVIGYCWCSTKHGVPIPSTSVEISSNKIPNCKHLHAIHVSKDQKIEYPEIDQTECSHVDRILFNSNILEVYRREYQNLLDENINHQSDENNETSEHEILLWRFNKLDLDKNDKISYDELLSEYRLIILIIHPTSCAKTFYKFCDKNFDKFIDLQEWIQCLKIDFSGNVFQESSDDDNSLKYEVRTDNSKDKIEEENEDFDLFFKNPTKKSDTTTKTSIIDTKQDDCKITKDKIIQTTPYEHLNTVFIPKCFGDDDKFFNEMQCHQKMSKKVCWCVHPITGEPINNGLVKSSEECHMKPLNIVSNKIQQHQNIKGCVPKKQLPFYHHLFKILGKEMKQSVPIIVGQKRRRPQIAKWKFEQLDVNGDKEINKKEWITFKKLLRSMKNYKKCGRNFIRFCDINNDKKLSRKEWIHCTVKNYRNLKKIRQPTTRPNPFLTLLKPED